MSTSLPSQGQANLQLLLWNKSAETTSDDDIYIRIQRLGLPQEVVSLLHALITKIKEVSGKVIQIGKIILIRILDFVEENLFLVAGAGIGALIGSAIFSLMVSVPFIGPFLAPLAKVIGITTTVTGAIIGHEIDKKVPSIGKSLREIADAFFKFFSQVLNTLLNTSKTVQPLPAS